MIRHTILSISLLASLFITTSCGSGSGRSAATEGDTLRPLYEARHAERFELLTDDRGPVLRVRSPWQGADSICYDYRLVADTTHALQTDEGEKARFIAKYSDMIAAGDPYYNRHFNLLFENYGLK